MSVTITHGEIIKRKLTKGDFEKSSPVCYGCEMAFKIDIEVVIDPYTVKPNKPWEETVSMFDMYHKECYTVAEDEFRYFKVHGRPRRRAR